MEMCYNEALVMPSSYTMMKETEMMYVEGGSYKLDCSKRYLSKSCCLSTASWLISTKKVLGMGKLQIAKEIFAHAYSYYRVGDVSRAFGTVIALYCYNKAADGIGIVDGGDKGLRSTVYDSFWASFASDESYR